MVYTYRATFSDKKPKNSLKYTFLTLFHHLLISENLFAIRIMIYYLIFKYVNMPSHRYLRKS